MLLILCIPLLSVGTRHEAVIKLISEQGTPLLRRGYEGQADM